VRVGTIFALVAWFLSEHGEARFLFTRSIFVKPHARQCISKGPRTSRILTGRMMRLGRLRQVNIGRLLHWERLARKSQGIIKSVQAVHTSGFGRDPAMLCPSGMELGGPPGLRRRPRAGASVGNTQAPLGTVD
jgi:hypothetical protein